MYDDPVALHRVTHGTMKLLPDESVKAGVPGWGRCGAVSVQGLIGDLWLMAGRACCSSCMQELAACVRVTWRSEDNCRRE